MTMSKACTIRSHDLLTPVLLWIFAHFQLRDQSTFRSQILVSSDEAVDALDWAQQIT